MIQNTTWLSFQTNRYRSCVVQGSTGLSGHFQRVLRLNLSWLHSFERSFRDFLPVFGLLTGIFLGLFHGSHPPAWGFILDSLNSLNTFQYLRFVWLSKNLCKWLKTLLGQCYGFTATFWGSFAIYFWIDCIFLKGLLRFRNLDAYFSPWKVTENLSNTQNIS